MENRPRITLQLSRFDKRLEIASTLLLLLMWVLFLCLFLNLPAIVPLHYNAFGKVDSYGNKSTLFILPLLTTVVYFGLTQLNKYPHIFNYMTTITKENAKQQYTIATRMLRMLKLSILIVFNVLIVLDYFITKGSLSGLSSWFLPFTIFTLLMPTVITIVQSRKKK